MVTLFRLLPPATVFLLLAGGAAGMPARAESAWKPRAEFTLASDSIYRGFSQTAGNPALQGSVRVQHEVGFSGGLWASTVDFDYDRHLATPRRIELRGFAGYARGFGEDWSASAVAVYHTYPNTDDVDGYGEIGFSGQYRDYVQVSLIYTPSVFSSDRAAFFAEASGRYPLPAGIDLTGGVGLAELDLDVEPRYLYGHVGITRPFRYWGVTLGYYASDAKSIRPWGEAIDGRWVVVISAWFPPR